MVGEKRNVAGSAGISVDGTAELGADESTSRSEDEEGSLRFLWAPKRMDGEPITTVSLGQASEAGGDSSSSADSDSNENSEAGGVPLIMYALLHHRQSFTVADGLTDLGTPTLHGEVSLSGSCKTGRCAL